MDSTNFESAMSIDSSSQDYQAYVPAYDYVPEKWDDARIMLVEALKLISNAVNVREIGWYLDQELLSGKSFYPSAADNQAFRSVFRIVIPVLAGIVAGVNTIPHTVLVDGNFTCIDLWATASNNTAPFAGTPINGTGNILAGRTGLDIDYDNANIYILSNGTYSNVNIFWEYVQEN